MVKTSGRSSSAMEARRPDAMASSYAWRAASRSRSSASTTRPSAVIRIRVTAPRSGSGKHVGGFQRYVKGVDEVLRQLHPSS